MGRLVNHATQRRNNADNREANMNSTSILLDHTDLPLRVAVMKARRQIEPFEQLRFNYGDKTAQELFTQELFACRTAILCILFCIWL